MGSTITLKQISEIALRETELEGKDNSTVSCDSVGDGDSKEILKMLDTK